MSKNENGKLLLFNDEKNKLLEAEQRLMNEGIIFQRRIFSHKKDNNKNDKLKSNNVKNNLSIKLSEQYIYKKENNININNIPNSMRSKKTSFTKSHHLSNDFSKYCIKKNNYLNTNITGSPYFSKSPQNNNNNNKNNLKHNSYKKNKNNSQQKSLNDKYFKESNIHLNGNLSPRIEKTNIKLENGYMSPNDRKKSYVNSYKSRGSVYENQKFNYKKWNKITVNNIFDKDINNEENESSNNGIEKDNNGLIYNKNDIKVNDNGIQEILIQNIKKDKKGKINDIPRNRKKDKNNNILVNSYIDKNNIFNYCKQMRNLALTKENKKNFTGETMNGLKFDQIIRSPENKKNIQINKANSLKKNKFPNDKHDSIDGIMIGNIYRRDSFCDLKVQKNLTQNKISKNHYKNNINTSKKKDTKYNLENKNIYRNNFHNYKSNTNCELNTQVIKIKNSKLLDFIKSNEEKNINNNDDNINNNINKKEIIANKYKEKDIIKEEDNDIKYNLYENLNEEIFNSNAELFNEKEKGTNYTFDNKCEIDSEPSFRILNNCNNNIFDNSYTIGKINKTNNNINNNNENPNSLKHKIFTKKKRGGLNIKVNSPDKDNKIIDNNCNNIINMNNIYKIAEKENIPDNINKYKGDYFELAKICANQEKIISDLVKNVQQLNNKICDKDLCINELNNQLYSIKYDLLNTLQKTNSK